ncbi:MAG: TRAP transporter substrate-binding protein DctP [Syntrophaceae bacterium]|nr:TRAP transporter substrate-binding protein DctP [Syntrophaceae bacterium]
MKAYKSLSTPSRRVKGRIRLNRVLQFAIPTLFICCFLVLASFSISLAQPKKFVIKAVSAWPKTVYETQNFLKFIDLVKENVALRYPGELDINYLGGPEITSNFEQVESLRKGLFDMVFTTASYYVSMIPVMDGINLTEYESWEERARGVNDFINEFHREKANCIYLGRISNGMSFAMYLKQPIEKAELNGLKIRAASSHMEFIKQIGGNPVAVPPTDIYTAMERGVIDGFVWPIALIKEWGWHEVVKYIVVKPTFYQAVNQVLINLDYWNKLPAHLQELLTQTCEQAQMVALERARKRIHSELDEFQQMGIKFIELPPEEAKKYKEIADSSFWKVVLKRSPELGPKFKEMLTK